MKSILTIMIFSLMGSTAFAAPGLKELLEFTTRCVAIKRWGTMHSSDLTKRHFSTKGYKPEQPSKFVFQQDDLPNQKIKFLDLIHERYTRTNQQASKSFKEKEISHEEKKDDHTLIVNLKKK